MFNTKDVTVWYETFRIVDIPDLTLTFSGIFGHILLLELGLNNTITIAEPIMGLYTKNILFVYKNILSHIQNSILDLLGVGEKDKEFIFSTYLPVLEENIGHIELSLLEKAELSENTLGTVIKLLYAFVWQEGVIKFPSGKYSPSDISLYILHGTISSYLQCTNKSLYF